MKIGIDAKWYFEGPISNKIVIRHLVDHLVEVNQEDELYFFLDKKSQHFKFPHQGKNIHSIYVWAGINQLSNIFVLPYYAQKYNLDALMFQNYGSFYGRFKKIVYLHDVIFLSHPQFFSLKERIYFYPMRPLARFSDGLIAISHSEKQRMVQYRLAESDHIFVVHHGNDPDFKPLEAHQPEELKLVKDKFQLPDKFILFVGRLNIRKNIQTLLKALPLLYNKELKLVIVGSPEWKTVDIHQIIRNLNLNEQVIFTGGVSKEELVLIYALSRYFCFPSFAEGFGLPALEAMASGIPPIVANTSSLPEVCGQAAMYIDPEKPQSIAEAVNTLEKDENLYRELQKKSLEQANSFDWQRTATEILKNIKIISSKK